jgi:uncharacterized protein (TIGR00251 family)
MIRIDDEPRGAVVHVKAVPNASRDRVVGALGESLKVSVSKPASEGQANNAIEKLIASAMGISRREVMIISGHAQARKQVLIIGCSSEQVRQRLGAMD